MSAWSSVETAMEEHGTAQETVRFDGRHNANVVLRVPWADRITAAADIINNNRLWPHASIGAIAAQIQITPVPSAPDSIASGLTVYQEALLQVTYDVATVGQLEQYPPEHATAAGQIYSETIEETIENLEINSANLRWGSDPLGKPVRIPVTRPLYGLALKRTLYDLVSVPSAIFTLPGFCNEDEYESVSLGYTFAPETLLFCPATLSRSMSTSGTKGWTVSMKLSYKKEGWNKFWNPDMAGGGDWDVIYNVDLDEEHKNFPTADFSSLLY